jgi:hypothetical protein
LRYWPALAVAVLALAACSGETEFESDSGQAPLTAPIDDGVEAGDAQAAASAESIPLRSYLGNPFSGDSLANLDVGGPAESSVAYRFVAERSGRIESLRPYIVVNTSRLGYAAGTGGIVQLSVVADDGQGLPDQQQVLATGSITMDLIDGHLPPPADTDEKRAQNFSAIPMAGEPLVAGQTYHVIFEQLDPDPVSNYVGLDLMYQWNTQLGPRAPVSSWGLTVRENDDPWQEFTERFGEQLYTPIMSIRMEDGYVFGNGYLEPFPEPESYRPIDDSSSIQVTFTTDDRFTASTWWLRALRTSDQGVLRASLEGSDGSDQTIDVPVSEFPAEEMRWIEWPWEFTFVSDVEYVLTLTGVEGGALSLFPLREGTLYNFEAGSVFGGVSRPSNDDGGYEGWHKDRNDDIFTRADIMMAWTL